MLLTEKSASAARVPPYDLKLPKAVILSHIGTATLEGQWSGFIS